MHQPTRAVFHVDLAHTFWVS